MRPLTEDVVISNARLEHSGQIYMLFVEALNEKMCKESAFRKNFWQNLYDVDFKYLVAVKGDEVVGFIGVHLINSLCVEEPIATIEYLMVKKSYNINVIKKKLMKSIENLVRSQNVWLDSSPLNQELQLAKL